MELVLLKPPFKTSTPPSSCWKNISAWIMLRFGLVDWSNKEASVSVGRKRRFALNIFPIWGFAMDSWLSLLQFSRGRLFSWILFFQMFLWSVTVGWLTLTLWPLAGRRGKAGCAPPFRQSEIKRSVKSTYCFDIQYIVVLPGERINRATFMCFFAVDLWHSNFCLLLFLLSPRGRFRPISSWNLHDAFLACGAMCKNPGRPLRLLWLCVYLSGPLKALFRPLTKRRIFAA